MQKATSVLIGIPHLGTVDFDFAFSLRNLQAPEGSNMAIFGQKRTIVHQARNIIVKALLESNYEWLLFLDSDQVFEPGLLNKLLATGKDFVGTQIFKRVPPYAPCIGKVDKKGDLISIMANELMEVDSIGMGATLIHRRVFEKINKPQFEFIGEKGEDIVFCEKVKKAGLKIWCDPNVEISHIGEPPKIGKQHFYDYINNSKRSRTPSEGGKN